ncbi:natterin-3-like isoform X1 [Parambassis ranga]|uniref:Natterin-3-like isoform X1 n=1 Tax=Parambassis ranga TaxID=210632 RepID=A0A6P7J3H2_9TELE|nr:natterin-3-like isoform X1 [Parambassis ranga]
MFVVCQTHRLVTMMLSVLLLLLLSSVSLQDTDEDSQHTNVSSMNAVLEDVPANRSGLTDQRLPVQLRQKRTTWVFPLSEIRYDHGNLKWELWQATTDLPARVVGIYNKYAERYDYICKNGCHSGFYNPIEGSYCQSPNVEDVTKFNTFEVLTNENSFEMLEWKDASSGSVPENSVRTCPRSEIYVGKNKYGLGKVDPRTRAFHLYWDRSEYKYSSYQVLTINRGVKNHQVSDVHYNTDEAVITKQPPETMRISVVRNAGCNPVVQTVTMTKEIQQERRWDISASISLGVTTTLSAGIPGLVSGELEISPALSFTFSGGQTVIETNSQSVTVGVIAPPNHICRVKMLGYKYKADIPFTARLQRTYTSGDTRATSIPGTYKGVQAGEVWTEVERCQPIPNATSCS